jgi:hypothetical protein
MVFPWVTTFNREEPFKKIYYYVKVYIFKIQKHLGTSSFTLQKY